MVVWGCSIQGGREEKPRFLKPQWTVGGGRVRGTRGGCRQAPLLPPLWSVVLRAIKFSLVFKEL